MPITWTRDEIVLACDLVRANGWRGLDAADPEVIALSGLLQLAPLHPLDERDDKFRNPNGVARKTWDIATQHPEYAGKPTRGNRLDRLVLEESLEEPDRMHEVARAIRDVINSGEARRLPDDELDYEGISEAEGRLLAARHLRRERSPRLRRLKIQTVKSAGRRVACEVCGFDFGRRYGPLGEDYIEVHHVLPLHASGPTRTRLDDLALLCANCHRMIHRSRPWLTPTGLQRLLS